MLAYCLGSILRNPDDTQDEVFDDSDDNPCEHIQDMVSSEKDAGYTDTQAPHKKHGSGDKYNMRLK